MAKYIVEMSKKSMALIKATARQKGMEAGEAADFLLSVSASRRKALATYAKKAKAKAKAKKEKAKAKVRKAKEAKSA